MYYFTFRFGCTTESDGKGNKHIYKINKILFLKVYHTEFYLSRILQLSNVLNIPITIQFSYLASFYISLVLHAFLFLRNGFIDSCRVFASSIPWTVQMPKQRQRVSMGCGVRAA